MNAHQLSQITNAARKAPLLPSTDDKKKSYIPENLTENSSTENQNQDFSKEDTLEVTQKEPPNFKPISNKERATLSSFNLNRDALSAQFYERIQELKQEHQKTLTLLNQFYKQEKNNLTGLPGNVRPRRTNHLIPDYLDYTENNTLLYKNFPDRLPDKVPGYTKTDLKLKAPHEKTDCEKELLNDVESTSNADSIELINHMWDKFTIDKYSDSGKRQSSKKEVNLNDRPKTAPPKTKEWTPVITIPKPFNMTLREEKKKEKKHTRSSIEVSLRQQIREEEEEQERRKRIRAREPPAHIYIPLYEEMCERREQRSRFNKENCVATTLAIQEPFSFAERDERKLKIKQMKKEEEEERQLNHIKHLGNFEAQPVPYNVLHSSVSDRLIEDQLYRKIKAKLRADDLMRSSAYPPRMQTHEMLAKEKKQAWMKELEKITACSFKPRTSKVPDFRSLHRREDLEAMNRPVGSEIVVRPFNLHTSQRSKFRTGTKAEDRFESNSFQSKHEYGKMPIFSETIPTRMTESARLRIENTQRSLQDADYAIRKEKLEDQERRERKKNLALRIKQKAAINETNSLATTDNEERMNRYKKQLREQQSNYNQFLHDIKRKVDERPLLFELHDQKIAKEQAERRYNQILQDSGLSDEFVTRKSQILTSSGDFDSISLRDLELINESQAEKSNDKVVKSVTISDI